MKTGIPNSGDRAPNLTALTPTADKPSIAQTSSSTVAPNQSAAPSVLPEDNQPERRPNLQEVTKITEQLNEDVQSLRRGLNFSIDDTLGNIVIKVIDQETKEIIRQIPSEEMLNISRSIEEFNSLLFEDIKA